jgi:hypothetical protein
MSEEFTQSEIDEATQFADLEDRAIDFLTNKLGWAAMLGRGVFSVDDSPSRKEAATTSRQPTNRAPKTELF